MMEVKLPIFSSSVQFLHYDRPERIENLTRVEAVFAVAADIGNHGVEIVEHDVLLRCAVAGRPVRLAHGLAQRRG